MNVGHLIIAVNLCYAHHLARGRSYVEPELSAQDQAADSPDS